MLVSPSTQEYDGAMTLIAWSIVGVMIAVPSTIGALIIGLPLRLIPAIRLRWLVNGEITVVGAVLGFIASAVLVASGVTAYALATPDGSYASLWLLCAAWVVFTVSVAHFVWPARWRRTERHSAGESHILE